MDLRRAQRPCEPAGPGLAGAGASPRRRRGRGDGAQPGLDGRRPGDLQGRRGVPAHRAALPGRSHRRHAVPGRVRARADRTGQHGHARAGPGRACRESELLFAEAAYAEDHADGDLGIEVGPDQLAYIYFTSGSTGEPKGAMCEHAGMLNHLYAKIDDLEIGAGQVVAQTAPQCFDISMWQLVSALLAGGRTLIVEQEVILDVARFVDTIADGRVNVLQVVPSYLEVVLSYLDQHPRELPDLRYVSVTGEALKRELAQRWFAAKPGIKLVNAYGLTETSDDTNHEVMDRAPDGERVPLGRAGQQRARLRGGRGPGAGAAGRARPDRLLRGLRRPRVHQRPRAHPAVLPDRPAPRGPAALPGRATTAAGGRTASWSSSAAGTARSRSAASASRSARSRTPCCGCPASATARWWSPRRPGQGQRLVAFYSGPRADRGRCPAGPAGRVAALVHGPGGLPLAGEPAVDRQQQD